MEQELGYYFRPPTPALPAGHLCLEFNLYSQPTYQHFDPQNASVFVKAEHGIEVLEISHPWFGAHELTLVAGRVALIDRVDKSMQAFCFGGRLSLHDQGRYTRGVLDSPAPILEITPYQPDVLWLVTGIEALLATRRGAWSADELEYEQRLAQMAPLDLCAICLANFETRLETTPNAVRTGEYWAQRHLINALQRSLAKFPGFPSETPTLEEVL